MFTTIKKLTRNLITSLLFFLGCTLFIQAQGWERLYDSTPIPSAIIEESYNVASSPDGGSVIIGTSQPNFTDVSMRIIKIDVDGVEQWRKFFGGSSSEGIDIKPTPDGGYILAGNQNNGISDFYVVKTDQAGNLMWEATYDNNGQDDIVKSVVTTLDGGYLVVGSSNDAGAGTYDGYMIKISNSGVKEWEYYMNGVGLYSGINDVVENSNGTYSIIGRIVPNPIESNGLISTLDANGSLLWTQTFNTQVIYQLTSAVPTLDGGLMVVGRTNNNSSTSSNIWLLRTDSLGVEQWSSNLSQITGNIAEDIVATPDGGYILPMQRAQAVKVDDLGNVVWSREFDNYNFNFFYGGTTTLDSSYVFVGNVRTVGFSTYVVKLDDYGNLFSSHLSGNVATDLNLNCTIDTLEGGLENWILKASGDLVFYGLTDTLGNYSINLDAGSYDLELFPPNYLWQPCQPIHAVQVAAFDITFTDFPVQLAEACVSLTTDISTTFLRSCAQSTYHVSYCNQGTITATGAYLEIDFDQYLTVDSSTIPWTSQMGNSYTFPIDDLEANECGSFQVYVTVDCNSTVLGQTHCVEAHIYPDSICAPPNLIWDGSITTVDATCALDSVTFTIENEGVGDMAIPQDYLVVEDNIIMRTGDFNLLVGEKIMITVPSNGSTYRLYADQAPGYFPPAYVPTVAIEGCGVNPFTQTFSTGFVTTLPEDDAMDYISIDCQENIGPYDPNDKRAEPSGFDAEHYIAVGDALEYHIRFQNIGTDTAFNVVIRDTVSQFLDVASLLPGTSSHAYDLSVINGNVLKFTFNDILLVDSLTNEAGSHGFVKFKISQKVNLPLGTIINNRAAIFFDYNAPVITNETYHEIGEDFIPIEIISSTETVPGFPDLNITVQPNPFMSYADFVLEKAPSGNKSFELYDAMGRQVRSEQFTDNEVFRFYKGSLTAGIYFYKIHVEGQLLGSGKVIAGS